MISTLTLKKDKSIFQRKIAASGGTRTHMYMMYIVIPRTYMPISVNVVHKDVYRHQLILYSSKLQILYALDSKICRKKSNVEKNAILYPD